MLLTRRLGVKERPNFLRQIRERTGRPRAGGVAKQVADAQQLLLTEAAQREPFI